MLAILSLQQDLTVFSWCIFFLFPYFRLELSCSLAKPPSPLPPPPYLDCNKVHQAAFQASLCIMHASRRSGFQDNQPPFTICTLHNRGKSEGTLGRWSMIASLYQKPERRGGESGDWGPGSTLVHYDGRVWSVLMVGAGGRSLRTSSCAHIGIFLDFLSIHRKFRGSFLHCLFHRSEEISALCWWKSTIWSLGKSSVQNKGLIRALQNYDEILRK